MRGTCELEDGGSGWDEGMRVERSGGTRPNGIRMITARAARALARPAAAAAAAARAGTAAALSTTAGTGGGGGGEGARSSHRWTAPLAAVAGFAATAGAAAASWGSGSPAAACEAAAPPAKAATDPAGRPLFTRADVVAHASRDDGVWVTYKDGVYDVSAFLDSPPRRRGPPAPGRGRGDRPLLGHVRPAPDGGGGWPVGAVPHRQPGPGGRGTEQSRGGLPGRPIRGRPAPAPGPARRHGPPLQRRDAAHPAGGRAHHADRPVLRAQPPARARGGGRGRVEGKGNEGEREGGREGRGAPPPVRALFSQPPLSLTPLSLFFHPRSRSRAPASPPRSP